MRTILGMCLLALAVPAMAEEIQNKTDAGYSLVFKEEVRFGAGEDDNTLWNDANSKLVPGKDGQMYVFDVAESRVLVFDKDGKFIRQAIGKGNGPGELHTVICVSQAADAGTIFVMDADPTAPGAAPRITRFDLEMNYIDTINAIGMPGIPAIVTASPDGKYLGGIFAKIDMAAGNNTLITGVMEVESKQMVNTITTIPLPLPDTSRMGEQSMWIDYLAEQFKILYNFGMITIGQNNQIYSAVSKDYRISRWEPGGKTSTLDFSREYKPIPFDDEARKDLLDHFYESLPAGARTIITRETLSKGLDKADLPPRKTPLLALLSIEDKAVMIVHDVDVKTRENIGDVFDLNGKYLCSVTVPDNGLYSFTNSNPSIRMIFRDGKAYAMHTNEDGDQIAVRYSYNLGKR